MTLNIINPSNTNTNIQTPFGIVYQDASKKWHLCSGLTEDMEALLTSIGENWEGSEEITDIAELKGYDGQYHALRVTPNGMSICEIDDPILQNPLWTTLPSEIDGLTVSLVRGYSPLSVICRQNGVYVIKDQLSLWSKLDIALKAYISTEVGNDFEIIKILRLFIVLSGTMDLNKDHFEF